MRTIYTRFLISTYAKVLAICVCFCLFYSSSQAQLIVTAYQTALQLTNALAGTGVTVMNPTLNCAVAGNGVFTTGAVSPLGIPNGIILTCGSVIDTTDVMGNTTFGVANPESPAPGSGFASADWELPGDPQLDALSGGTTHDACVLEFDFRPAGDTVKFNYVFGSEEYFGFTCSEYNDVFGFFISGGAYTTATNLALVPGTNIPVCINSVNCGPSAGYPLATCNAVGLGSPFCSYYVDNTAASVISNPYVVYNGLTTLLQVVAAVSPCDTYHLKLGIADASDWIYDSGVFIEGGSLTSATTTGVTATGTSGLPFCIRGCAAGNFVFSTPVPQDTAIVIHYIITGTAVNGYDYTTIPDSVIIAPMTTATVLNINTLTVPAAGPKVVTLEIQVPDPCHPGIYSIGAEANLTILDSFSFHIQTPDTSICNGQVVNIIAIGDPLFDSILHFTWSPSGTINFDTSLTPTATPTITTTYTLTATTSAALGCAPESHEVTITVYNPAFDSVHVISPSVCGYTNGSLVLYGLQTGYTDTVFYNSGAVPDTLPVTVSGTGNAYITGLGAGIYNNIYVKVGFCRTVVKGPDTLVNPAPPTLTVDSALVKTCVGVPVQLNAYPSFTVVPYYYSWTPGASLSNTTIPNPIVDPNTPGDILYTVTGNTTSPATAACASSAIIDVHTEPNDFTLLNTDTSICLGQNIQVNINGSGAFSYSWTPPAGVSNTTIMDPVITPVVATAPDSTFYTVTASYANCPLMVHSFSIKVDTPAPPTVFVDTICLGMTQPFDVSVAGAAASEYQYVWTITSGGTITYLNNDSIPNPIADPTITGLLTYNVTIAPPHVVGCANTDIIDLFVLPNTINLSNPDTAICSGQSVQVRATGDPLFTYQWIPTAGIAVSNDIAPLIAPDTSATYVITASFHLCPDIHDTLRIDVQPRPVVSIGNNRPVCLGDTLHINAVVTPLWYSHYIYNWSPAAGLDNTTASSVVFTAGDTTELKVTVYAPIGLTTDSTCSTIDSILLIEHSDTFLAHIPDLDFCPQQSVTLSAPGAATYHWYPSMYISDSLAANPVLSPETSLSYSVIGTSVYGCQDTVSFNVTVHPAAVISLGDTAVTLYPGETYQMLPETNCSSFTWFPPSGLSNAYISNPVASPDINTRYIVTGTTEWGCTATDSISIYISAESLLALPNAFTPGSETNSEFKILKRGLATLNYFRIFNRWGNMVFETNDINKGWDGQYNGTPQPFGVYIYEVEAVTTTGKIFTKHGNTTLIR